MKRHKLIKLIALIIPLTGIGITSLLSLINFNNHHCIVQRETYNFMTDESYNLSNRATCFSDNSFDINVNDANFIPSFFVHSIPAYVTHNTNVFFINFIYNFKNYFFENLPPDIMPDHFIISDLIVSSFDGYATFKLTINYGLNEYGLPIVLNLEPRQVCLSGLKRVEETKVNLCRDGFRKDKLPTSYTQEDLIDLISINTQKICVWDANLCLGCNNIYDLTEPLGILYDAHNVEINVIHSYGFLGDAIPAYNCWTKGYRSLNAMYNIIGNKEAIKIEILEANNGAGILIFNVIVTNGAIMSDGSYVDSYVFPFTVSNIGYRDTFVKNGQTLLINKVVDNVTNREIAKCIINQQLIVNGAYQTPFEYLVISNRKNNSVFGVIECSVTIENYKVYEKRELIEKKTFHNVKLYGYKTVQPTIQTDMLVDASDKFRNKPINESIGNLELISYILLKHGSRFYSGLIPETDSSNFAIIERINDQVNGRVKLILSLNRYYCYQTGQLITQFKGLPCKGQRITLLGFMNKGLTTILKNDKPYRSYNGMGMLVSEFINNKVRTKLEILRILKLYLKNLSYNRDSTTLTIDDFNFSLDPEEVDNAKGEFKFYLTLKKCLAWVNGEIIKTYDFNRELFTINGFRTQAKTQQITNTITLSKIDSVSVENFTYKDAESIMNCKIDSIFKNLPYDSRTKVSHLEANKDSGVVDVTFRLSTSYNEKGMLIINDAANYEITIYGFKTPFTTLLSKEIKLNDCNNLYSISNKINDAWIKSKLDKSMFRNLPVGYDLINKTEVVNIRNSWNDLSVPFGTIKFDLIMFAAWSLRNVETIYDICFSGFKTNDASTTYNLTTLVVDEKYSKCLPSEFIDTFSDIDQYKKYLTKLIFETNKKRTIFHHLIPQAILTEKNIIISNLNNVNNKEGVLDINGYIKDVAWVDGIIKEKTFNIPLIGFEIQEPTKWTNILRWEARSLINIPADCWDNHIAKLFILSHINCFVENIPELDEKDIEVNIEGVLAISSMIALEIRLNKYYNSAGILSYHPPMIKDILIQGFQSLKVLPTIQIEGGLSRLFKNKKIFHKKSSFTCDILGPKIKEYEKEILDYINTDKNIACLLENYLINDQMIYAQSVKLHKNISNPFTAVDAHITFSNCCIGINDYATLTFIYPIFRTHQIPIIHLDSCKLLSLDAIEEMIYKYKEQDSFRMHLVERIYESLTLLIEQNNSAYPKVVKDIFFNVQHRDILINAINKGLMIRYSGNELGDISYIKFNAYYLLRLKMIESVLSLRISDFIIERQIEVQHNDNINPSNVINHLISTMPQYNPLAHENDVEAAMLDNMLTRDLRESILGLFSHENIGSHHALSTISEEPTMLSVSSSSNTNTEVVKQVRFENRKHKWWLPLVISCSLVFIFVLGLIIGKSRKYKHPNDKCVWL